MAVRHDLPLVTTLAIGMSAAFVCGLIASKLRIPPIVGYLIAGILVGPYTPGFEVDVNIAEELSEIGIVLLMFGVGLHFSLNDFMEVKKIALTGALSQIAIVTTLGAGISHLWGWPWESSILFGLSLSVASTVVLLRAFEERNLVQTMHGHIAIGWLVIEDLAMILALVLIPALAANESGVAVDVSPLQQLFIALGKIGLFILIMLVAGKRLLPWLLTAVTKTRSRELFTLAVFAMAIGIAFSASQLFGVSFALGAFFAGMMIRESDLNHEVANRALPFQDAFAVLFFVSIGMLFNPHILLEQPLHVLTVTAIIMLGNFVVSFSIVMLFGYQLKTALLVSSGLAQIGEFSFILVTVGLAYGLLPEDGRDLILAGAMTSIALNPVAFFISRKLYEFAERTPRLCSDEKYVLKDLVILAGHGRVGRQISKNIHDSHIDLVVIDNNRERVEALRENGFHAIAGDASQQETLKEAAIHKAVALVVSVPDPFEARRIVESARTLKPSLKILVRAHNEEERDYFITQNADLATTGPRAIGQMMANYLNDMRLKKAD
ncbi:MAG: sodium:proton antiporter [Alphaproteobacteria bacterium PRO2]|nr:sodium:proton antiporter [Alphaproteobacteria bacterium PRO2]